jgi:hypothetical protein
MNIARTLAACLAAALTACGGGGDDGAPASEQYLEFSKAGVLVASSRVGDCAARKRSLAQLETNGFTLTCTPTWTSTALTWAAGAEVDSARFVVQTPNEATCRDLTNWLSGPAFVYASCRAM